ncbi:MAG: methyltransferase [Sphingomicrobium sp.]
MRALSIVLGLALGVAVPAMAPAAPADVAAAVAAPGRTPDNVKLDAGRKPAEILAFMGLEQGMRVLDMFGGNRYWAELLAPAVGPAGQVIVWNPTQFLNDKRKADFAEFAARQPNAALIYTPFEAPLLGTADYDFLIMNLDYHDVYWQSEERKIPRMEPGPWLARLYAAMRPGAILAIIDHAAAPGGDTRAVVEKLHRIDPAVVRADFERAGFVLEGESDLLRNPADDHSLLVFDEKIRGKTDRFAFKFRKPS